GEGGRLRRGGRSASRRPWTDAVGRARVRRLPWTGRRRNVTRGREGRLGRRGGVSRARLGRPHPRLRPAGRRLARGGRAVGALRGGAGEARLRGGAARTARAGRPRGLSRVAAGSRARSGRPLKPGNLYFAGYSKLAVTEPLAGTVTCLLCLPSFSCQYSSV